MDFHHAIKQTQTEEDVKSVYAAFFKLKYSTADRHDLYTPQVFFEFKFDRNFRNEKGLASTLAQTLYYIRRLKYSIQTQFDNCIDKPIPPVICLAEKNHAVLTETATWRSFFDNSQYDWDLAPSMPDAELVNALTGNPAIKKLHVYNVADKNEFDNFAESLKQYFDGQYSFKFALKKVITEENFEDVYEYWNQIFGESVKNNFKPSRYFVTDIQEHASWLERKEGKVYFKVGQSGKPIAKKIIAEDYDYFWSLYEKVTNPDTARSILTKIDRITDIDQRRRFGEFFTPLPFAKKALEYIEKTLGKQWWKSGKYRLWDMAAGTGNLEYFLPQDALKYCYLSTIYDGDVEHLKKVFSEATIFQYDYLNDDVDHLFAENGDSLKLEHTWKLPETLRNDLQNPKIKWIVLINPPFATAQEAGMKGKSKAQVADTRIRFHMHQDHLGEVSRELFSQFIYRIKNEFEGKSAYFGLFSKLTYLIANNDQRLRDEVFRFGFLSGFTFSSANFHGTSKNSPFPVGFLLWDLSKEKKLETQTIKLETYNAHVEKYSQKIVTTDAREHHLSKWIVRPPATIQFPPFCSAITLGSDNIDRRDRIAECFLASFMCPGNDLQNQRRTAFLSGPQASAGALSVTPDNFEQAVIVFAARLIPKATWLNDRDQFMMPNRKLSKTFISDCAVWSLFHNANQTVAMKNVKYEGKVYQVVNHFFPFSPLDFSGGVIADAELERSRKQMAITYVADWLAKQKLSPHANKVLESAKQIYALFYGSLDLLRTPKFKIETFDAGWWQIRKSLQDVQRCEDEFAALKVLHDQLRVKLLPQFVDYGIVRSETVR